MSLFKKKEYSVDYDFVGGLTYRERDRTLIVWSFEVLGAMPPEVRMERSDLRVWSDGSTVTEEDRERVMNNIETSLGGYKVNWE